MIDPITIGAAYMVAKSTIGGIKEAIKLGEDAGEIAGKLSKFFHSASQIEKASVKIDQDRLKQAKEDIKKGNRKTYYELTADAMDIAIKAEEVKRFETEIKDLLIWSGRGHIYHAMISERNRMEREIAQTEALELLEQANLKKLAAERREYIIELIWVGVAIVLTGLAFWGIIEFMIAKGMVGR
jgi:RNA:NAD 2'-phosphotransferase (TPT1/KptA family)